MADFGVTGLAASLYGADGLPYSPDQFHLELIEAEVKLLHDEREPHIYASTPKQQKQQQIYKKSQEAGI